MKTPSVITPHDDHFADNELFVASGSTCACYLLKLHGRLLLKKQLLPAYADDNRHREALEKEFEVGFQLNHPNIPNYLEFHGDSLLMEYVDGETLTDFIKHHPTYFRQRRHARQLVDELLSAVAYLHQHQVLHLDLKPDNIMLTRIGYHVKLIDLGYCYQDSFPFTTGGSAHYSAPDKEKTPASDIYSLGRIFQELGIGGKKVMDRCLSANPAERYQSVEELALAMRMRDFPWKAIAAILLPLLLGIFGWWWMAKNDTPVVHSRMEKQEIVSDKAQPDSASPAIVLPSDNMQNATNDNTREVLAGNMADGDLKEVVKGRQEKKPDQQQEEVSSQPEEQIDFLSRDRREAMKVFMPVTDSILSSLKLFVADDSKPIQMGGLEAYCAAYDSLKRAAFAHGRGQNTPFWIQMIWAKFDGKPKPYDPYGDYLFKQLAAIESLFQTHAMNYKHSQQQHHSN